MTENRTSSGGPQGQSSTPPVNLVERLAGPLLSNVWVATSDNWTGNFYDRDAFKALNPMAGHYMSCALIQTGSRDRDTAHWLGGWLFVLDDVVTVKVVGSTDKEKQIAKADADALAPPPIYIVITSPGNHQYGYRLKPEYDLTRWRYFLAMIEAHPIFSNSAKQGDLIHYYRTETGANYRKGGFQTKLIQDYDGSEWALDDLAAYFGIDMSPAAVAAWAAPRPKGPRPGAGAFTPEVVREVLDIIPNHEPVLQVYDIKKGIPTPLATGDYMDRSTWTGIAHAIRNEGLDRDDWLAWNAKKGQREQDAGVPEYIWDTLPADSENDIGTLRIHIANIFGPDSDEYRRAGEICAQAKVKEEKVFDDVVDEPGMPPPAGFSATPFVLPDAKSIPPREWVYGQFYIRKYVSGLVAPGGVGKTSLAFVEALAMASGKELLGVQPRKRIKVWLWNGEDPKEELDRRLVGVCLHYGLTQADLEGYLFRDTGREKPLIVAKTVKGDIQVQAPVVKELVAEIKRLGIEVMVIDPFISCHQVPENSNDGIDAVVKSWGAVAEAAGCSVLLVHHSRKLMPGVERSGEDARGASAFRDGIRVLRIINAMGVPEATKWGVTKPRDYFRTTDDKGNMSAALASDDWYQFVSVGLGNGVAFPADGGTSIPEDWVGVVTKWSAPAGADLSIGPSEITAIWAAMKGRDWRHHWQGVPWIGGAVGKGLGLDVGVDAVGRVLAQNASTPEQLAARKRVREVVETGIKDKWLVLVEKPDRKSEMREFVAVGAMPDDVSAL